MGISAVVLTRNEEKCIDACLANIVDIVNEIVIVDGYSEDKTIEIAKRYTDKIYLRQPQGFVEPDRNFAILNTENEWVLYIDADERPSDAVKSFIATRQFEEYKDIVAYEFPRRNYYDIKKKRWTKHVFYPDLQIRLFKKEHILYTGQIHEKPKIINGKLKILPDDYYLVHLVPHHFDFSTFKKHHLKYVKIEARQKGNVKNRSYYFLNSFKSFCLTFFSLFFINKGFLDGYAGIKASLMLSSYKFMVNYYIWKGDN